MNELDNVVNGLEDVIDEVITPSPAVATDDDSGAGQEAGLSGPY